MIGRPVIILAVAVALGSVSFVAPDALGQQGGQTGKNYDIYELGDLKFQWVSHPERILDPADNEYKEWIVSQVANIIQVESEQASYVYDRNTCSLSFFNGGKINPGDTPIIKSDSYIALSSVDGITFNPVSQINDAACQTTLTTNSTHVVIEGTKSASGIGEFTVQYVKKIGTPLKTNLIVKNESGVDRYLGITQTIQIPRTIHFAGQDRDLSSFDGTSFDHDFIVNNRAELVKITKRVAFDMFFALNHIQDVVVGWDGTQASLAINYFRNAPLLESGQTLFIDPTFTSSDPSIDGYIADINNNNVCDSSLGAFTNSSSGTLLLYGLVNTANDFDCYRAYVEFDISSIPVGAVVNEINMTLTNESTEADNCEIVEIDQPSEQSASTVWSSMNTGQQYASWSATNSTKCWGGAITPDDKTFSVILREGAEDDMESNISAGWIAYGIKQTDDEGKALDGSDHNDRIHSEEHTSGLRPVLNVTYTGGVFSPGPPINVQVTSSLVNQINVTWTPDNATGVTGYTVWNNSANSPNDWEWDDLALTGNFTGSEGFHLHTGLGNCEQMYYKVSAFSSNNGTNATSTAGITDGCSLTLTQSIFNIGDMFKVNGTILSSDTNITSITLRENGTLTDTNSTGQNVTGNIRFNYEFWERVTVDGPRNLTTTVFGQDSTWANIANESKGVGTREYEPKYKDAITTGQGRYNYTVERSNNFDTVNLKANRINVPAGETWDLNCRLQTGIEALVINGTEGTWFNQSNTGYRNITATGWSSDNMYGTCVNQDHPIFTFVSYTNGSIVELGIAGLDDLYGGFVGVPIGILFVALFSYMATPKTAPTYTIFVVALMAIMGAAGFFVLTDNTWALIIIGAAIGLLVKKLL